MDISVKKLSEILKIDPQVLLDKMIAAGLSQSSIEDSVSNEDKQKLLYLFEVQKILHKKVKVKLFPSLNPQKLLKGRESQKIERFFRTRNTKFES